MLHVGYPGCPALVGDTGVQGLRGGEQHRAPITRSDDHRAVPALPVAVDGVGREGTLYEAQDPVQLRVREARRHVELGDVYVLGRVEVGREVPRPEAHPRRVPQNLYGAFERRGPTLLVALAEPGFLHPPQPLLRVTVLRAVAL